MGNEYLNICEPHAAVLPQRLHLRLHVPVKVLQVHVFSNGLEVYGEAELLTQGHGQRALAGADEAGYTDKSVGEGGAGA